MRSSIKKFISPPPLWHRLFVNAAHRALAGMLLIGLHTGSLLAGVSQIEIKERSLVLEGRSLGPAGGYERISGVVRFSLDPAHPSNQIITDLRLAPRDENGKVPFRADFYILCPVDSFRGNGVLLFEVSNRGRKLLLDLFNFGSRVPEPQSEGDFGDLLLMQRGFTIAWVGWQFDLPEEPGLLRLDAPVAMAGGEAIRGLVRSEFVPSQPTLSFSLGDRTMRAYPAASVDDPQATLTERETATGPRRVIPRERWRFARSEEGRPVEDRGHVFLEDGFEPGRIYEVVYIAQNPAVVGVGLAAVRDFVSYLKAGLIEREQALSHLGGHLRHAIAFGTSQSGRFLRHFLYQGFNRSEEGRKVFDGMMIHIAGAGRGSFNHRFAQPSRDAHPFLNLFYPTDLFPFTDLPQTDPASGLREGLLDRSREAGVAPRIFYTNSSYEYWGRAASLTHTSLDGARDFPPAPESRIYLLSGTHHSPGSLPPVTEETRHPSNPNDYRFLLRGLLVALERWVTAGQEPPPSRYPRLEDGTLVRLEDLKFPGIPGVELPGRPHRPYRLDFGSEFRSGGIVSLEPPRLGAPFPILLPQVGADGNETAGIRLPDLSVPVATHTGWNLRGSGLGASEEIFSMVGSWLPLAATREERRRSGDPRPSLEERYRERADFLKRVEAAARALAEEGYVLAQDVPRLVERSARLWALAAGPQASSAEPVKASQPE